MVAQLRSLDTCGACAFQLFCRREALHFALQQRSVRCHGKRMVYRILSLALLSSFACKGKQNQAAPAPQGSNHARLADAAQLTAPLPPAPPVAPLATLATNAAPATGRAVWSLGLGGLGSDLIRDLAIAPDGDAFAVGYFEGEANFVARDATSPDVRKAVGDADAFITKISKKGVPLWTATVGGKGGDVATAVATSARGIAVVGNFLDEATIAPPGTTAKPHKLTGTGSDDAFVALFAPDGGLTWAHAFGGSDSDGFNAIAATPDGGWLVGGSFTGKITIGAATLTSAGATDALLIKLDNNGTPVWAKQFGGLYNDSIYHLAVDISGQLVVQGLFAGQVSWGGAPLRGKGGSDADIVLAKFDGNGNHLWSQSLGSQGNEVAGGVAVDAAGNIAFAGAIERDATFGSQKYVWAGESDGIVGRLAPDGTLLWTKSFGGPREDIAFAVGVDGAGNVTVTGWFFGKMTIDGANYTTKGNKDIFVASFDVNGPVRWVKTFGDRDHDQGRALAVDAHNRVWVGGVYRFSMQLLAPTFESYHAPEDRTPKADIFVAQFEP